MSPDERHFRADLDKPPFRQGNIRQHWRIVNICWPRVVAIVVSRRSGQEYPVRFLCEGYPLKAATAMFWDLQNNCDLPHDSWPTPSPSNERMQGALRHRNEKSFYLPCDGRWLTEGGHPEWRQQFPEETWDSELGIVSYLKVLRDVFD